jgi:hypothetical protein
MTILRQDACEAFSNKPESPTEASFIDGQIKLMKADSVQTWSHFLYSQFTSVVMRHFNEYGCKTVVLAFDDKRHVPRAKAITQLKRRDGVQIIQFHEHDILPETIPHWKEAIMNPNFKAKVIQLIVSNVPRLVNPPDGCTLIMDWEEIEVYEYGAGSEPKMSKLSLPYPKVGEADIKFAQWMQHLQRSMLLEATDGDYIPISLGLKTAKVDHPVTILKGFRENSLEFIDIDRLLSVLQKTFRHAARGRDHEKWWEIKLFIALLGFAGTDFTRNLPLVSPSKIWSSLPLVVSTFAMEGDTQIDMAQGKRLIELLYSESYPKHFDPFCRTNIYKQAQGSKLCARYKALIPTDGRIVCTLKNINFLMEYWLLFQPPGDITAYGFRLGTSGVVEWDD